MYLIWLIIIDWQPYLLLNIIFIYFNYNYT